MLTVDLDAIAENWRALSKRTAPAECGAVVKADGYGVGLAQAGTALAAAGCTKFFVATIDEGIALRTALGKGPVIYVLNGLMGTDTTPDFVEFGLTPVLNTPGEIGIWADHCRNADGGAAILSLDTGMARLGLSPVEARVLADAPGALDGITLDFVMSHLACAEDATHPKNREQRSLFDELRAALPATPASLANSGGIFLGADFHYELSRPGAALYGVSRSTGAPENMKQVVGLKGKILQTRIVDSESTVGYGATHSVPAGSRLATVAAGYADGYLRSISNSGHGYAAGVKVPVVGRVSMDLITFDISAVPQNAIGTGDDIDMICEQYTIDDLADDAGTIGYEILTALGHRYARTYTGGDAS